MFSTIYLGAFKYPGECKDYMEEIQLGGRLLSKHNESGVLTVKALIPNVVVSFSREQDINMTIKTTQSLRESNGTKIQYFC